MFRRGTSEPRIFLPLVAVLLLLGGFLAGIATDRSGILPGTIVQEPPSAASTFSVFWESWDLVHQQYVDRAAVNDTKMTYGAIAGMLQSLGDTGHSRFLSPEDLRNEEAALSGHFEGIGAEVTMQNGRPTVIAPIPGSPAQRAGLKPGDIIVRVDGQDVAGLSLDDILNRVRGPAGTSVTLSVLHPGEMTVTDVTIVRAPIAMHSVSWVEVPGTTVAHVLVSQFAEEATEELRAALNSAQAAKVTGIILDLRNDPGGLRDEAIGVASQFLRQGNVLIEQDAEGKHTDYGVRPGGVALDIPITVLINEGTASAAEIVAGALQDQQRGMLVGMTTFGTGTVLSTYRLSDGSAILLGTAEWLTPNGRQIWHQGIVPDIQVTLPVDSLPLVPDEEATFTSAQVQASQDAQLLRALQELSQKAIMSP